MNHPNNRARRTQATNHRHRVDRLPHIHRQYPKLGILAGSTLDDTVLGGSLPLTWHEVVPDLSATNTEQARNGNYTVRLDRNDDQLLLFAKMFFEPHNSPMEQHNAQNTALNRDEVEHPPIPTNADVQDIFDSSFAEDVGKAMIDPNVNENVVEVNKAIDVEND